MHNTYTPSREEVLHAAQRLRMQRRAFLENKEPDENQVTRADSQRKRPSSYR